MIRDPSDGSTREKRNDGTTTIGVRSDMATGDPKPPMPPESGLPETSSRPDYLARLKRSREQLAEYRVSGKFANEDQA